MASRGTYQRRIKLSSRRSDDGEVNRCPHAQLRRPYKSTTQPLSAWLECAAAGCLACDLVLRVIEEIRPGWIDANRSKQVFVRITQDSGNALGERLPVLIELLVSSHHDDLDGQKGKELVVAFQIFRGLRGTFYLLARVPTVLWKVRLSSR